MNNQFHPNQIFYVKDIGYARILIDKTAKEDQKIKQNKVELPPTIIKTISQPKQEAAQQDEDVQFDPDMFNIQPERTVSKNGQQVSGELINIANQRRTSMENRQARQTAKQIKIIGLKLQSANVQIFAQQSLLLRKINLKIKAMLHNQRKQIQIQIDIIKTIDVLKTYIFDKIGEEIGYYSDIRIFATTPSLQELNVGSKTIWQCGLKSNSRIIVTGKFNFTFKSVQAESQTFYTLSNGNMTVVGAKPVKKQEVAVLVQVVQTSNQEQNVQSTTVSTNISEQNTNATITTNISVNQQIAEKTKENQILKEAPLHLHCNGIFSTGMHYWEIKLQKIQQLKSEKAQLFLGICLKDNQNKLIAYWGYDPIKLKKIHLIPQKKKLMDQKQSQEQDQNSSDDQYGTKVKNGDVIGVLLILKQKSASLIFYKNSICFEECHKINTEQFKQKKSISPFVMIRGECQITLDSKAIEPLDVCRRR